MEPQHIIIAIAIVIVAAIALRTLSHDRRGDGE
jgi:hypothetical protein